MLKEEQVFVASGKRKGSVGKETCAVCGMRVTILQSQRQYHPQRRDHEEEVCREREMPEAGATLRNSIDRRVKLNRDVSSAKVVHFRQFLFTVITWNPEPNCTCRLKNHSLFHSNTLTFASHTDTR